MTDATPTATSSAALLDHYFAMWHETDPTARAAHIAAAFVPDGRHVDPIADARGHDELDTMVANVHAHYPGSSISRTSGVDQHGDQLRFAWELRAADGSLVVTGLDVGELAPDGRLARISGFWGDLPAC